MKLETFFEKFDQFADAPDAVAKMRELVLELGVKGKLVAQDNRDESASLLLERTKAERARLIAARKIKSRTSVPVEDDERPFELPANWAWARLLDVGHELGQKVPDMRFTYIDVGGIDSDKGRISERVEVLEPGDAPSRARKLVNRGTVIYSTVRPYLLNIAIIDQDFDSEPIASTAFGILHPFESINNRYLFYWLRSTPFTAYVQAGMKGMAYPAINDEKFYSGPIALPPLAEQKRIVAKVDELMALCDRLEVQQQGRDTRRAALARASLARFADAPTPANLNFLFHKSYDISPADLRKSILTLAVQGKLVPQDPNDEPAEKLFAKIQTERAQQEAKGACKVAKTPPPIQRSEEPFKLPVEWKWVRLRSLVFTLGDGLHGTPEYLEGADCYFINGNNLIDGRIVIKPHTKTVSLPQAEKHRKPLTMNTVLVSINGTLGSVAFYNNENVILGKSACYFNLASLMDKHFVRRVIESPYFVHYAEKNATGSTIRNLGLKAMNYFPLPLPPLAEQRRIVAKVDQFMALVDELENHLAASRATAKHLLEALVAELTAAGTPSRRGDA